MFKNISTVDTKSLFRMLHKRSKQAATAHSAELGFQIRAFSSEYFDPDNEVGDFLRYVRSCSVQYINRRFHFLAPFICVAQSSGYGKTRLLLESSRRIRTMYVCMQPEQATGFPARSYTAIRALFGSLNMADADEYIEGLVKKFKQCWYSAMTNLRPDKVDPAAAMFQSELLAEVWSLDDVRTEGLSDSEELVLLVFDEGRGTFEVEVEGFSQFQLIRLALRKYSEANNSKNPIFAVFIDALPEVQQFLPLRQHGTGHSTRQCLLEMERPITGLFRPWIVRGSFDALFKPLPATTMNLGVLVGSNAYLRAGRPMMTVFEALGRDEELEYYSRMLCGGILEMTHQAALSHMLCRMAAYIYPQHPLSTKLVTKHMATLLATDAEVSSSLVSYVAEPKLAVAAALRWNAPNLFATKLIPALHRALAGGALDHGSGGQLVAQVVMLCAYDRACRLSCKYPGECVVLRSVLEQLLPESVDTAVLDALPAELLQSHSACCQFVSLCRRFGHGELVALAERHCGCLFRRDKLEGADLAVPILGNPAGVLLVQVKGRSTLSKLDPEFSLAKDEDSAQEINTLSERSVRVAMQLGASECQARIQRDRDGRSVLELYGIGARCLDRETRSALGVLLNEHITLASFVENNGFEEDVRGRLYGPDPNALQKVRRAWPFLEEPNPTVREMTKRELLEVCKEHHVETNPRDSNEDLIRKLTAAVEKASEGTDAS